MQRDNLAQRDRESQPPWFTLLVCPDCRVNLQTHARGLLCPRCHAEFPFEGGVPKLWPPSRAAHLAAAVANFQRPHAQTRQAFRALLPPSPICDPGAVARRRNCQAQMARGLILNVGSKAADWGPHVINFDLVLPEGARKTDLLGDLERLPFAEGALDGVICTNVLEHVADAGACLAEIARVLKPGGALYITVPFIFPRHPDPLDCRRWTLDGLRRDLKAFEELDAGICGGPFSALVAVVPAWLAAPFSNYYLFNAVRNGLGWLLWPVKFLDHIAVRSPRAIGAAASFYYLGRRKK